MGNHTTVQRALDYNCWDLHATCNVQHAACNSLHRYNTAIICNMRHAPYNTAYNVHAQRHCCITAYTTQRRRQHGAADMHSNIEHGCAEFVLVCIREYHCASARAQCAFAYSILPMLTALHEQHATVQRFWLQRCVSFALTTDGGSPPHRRSVAVAGTSPTPVIRRKSP